MTGGKQCVFWPSVEREVKLAVRRFQPDKKFVNTRLIVNYIDGNRSQYKQFRFIPFNSIKYRVSQAMKRMGWKKFNSGKRPAVYIDPRVRE
jgi:hypothetical protein